MSRIGPGASAVIVTALIVTIGMPVVCGGSGTAWAADPAADSSPASPPSRADIRDRHGPPDAWAIVYFDELQRDGSARATAIEHWTYYGEGVEYTFAGEDLVDEASVLLKPGRAVEPVPYDPDQFAAYMSLDEVVAAGGLTDYVGGSIADLIEGGETYFADGLTFGLKDGELRYIEALAFTEVASPEEGETS